MLFNDCFCFLFSIFSLAFFFFFFLYPILLPRRSFRLLSLFLLDGLSRLSRLSLSLSVPPPPPPPPPPFPQPEFYKKTATATVLGTGVIQTLAKSMKYKRTAWKVAFPSLSRVFATTNSSATPPTGTYSPCPHGALTVLFDHKTDVEGEKGVGRLAFFLW